MTARRQAEERLERLTNKVLRTLPSRSAPSALEARVWEAITERARLPWWRRGPASWPVAVRMPVIAGCAVCVPLVWLLSLLAGRLVTVTAHPYFAGPMAAARDTGRAIISLEAIGSQVLQAIPRDWLLGGIAATGLVYATLFGLIALGYSLLYRHQPEPSKA